MERAPVNPHGFDEHKLTVEENSKTIDRINAYQSETRQRVDTLLKSIFVLSGGALTISIGIFLRSVGPELNEKHMQVLQLSWGLLFYSLAAASLVLFIMIIQGYYLSGLWKNKHATGEDKISSNKFLLTSRVANWCFGITGFISFLIGLYALAYVAIVAIDASPNNPFQPTVSAAAELNS